MLGSVQFSECWQRKRTFANSGLTHPIRGLCKRDSLCEFAGMDAVSRLHRACCVFLAHLLIVYGADAPDVLRRRADQLDELARENLDTAYDWPPHRPNG